MANVVGHEGKRHAFEEGVVLRLLPRKEHLLLADFAQELKKLGGDFNSRHENDKFASQPNQMQLLFSKLETHRREHAHVAKLATTTSESEMKHSETNSVTPPPLSHTGGISRDQQCNTATPIPHWRDIARQTV